MSEVGPVEMYSFVSEALTFSAEELILLLPEYREEICSKGLEDQVKEIDIFVLSHLDRLPEIWKDSKDQPLEKWWWHLRKIAELKYPKELLPSHLRPIYEKALKTRYAPELPVERRYRSCVLDIDVGEWGPAMWIPELREQIREVTPEIEELDRIVIEEVLKGSLDWLPDDDTKPLEKWWWHLQKIYRRKYPAALLPSHLRPLYEEALASD